MATKGNNKVKTAERLARLETNQEHFDEKLDAACEKLDSIKETIDKWKGQFAILAGLGGLLGGGIVSGIVFLIWG